MKNQKSRTSNSKGFKSIITSKAAIASFVVIFVIVGVFIIIRSYAATGIPVFNTDPDYWRDRIGYCESGGRYDRIGPSGHTGKYQYDARTWRSAVGPELAAQYPQAYQAPGEIQELAFNNTFARRGTQPWNASYRCWIKGTTFAADASQSLNAPAASSLPTAPILPPNPFGLPSESYNVTVNGRITLNEAPLPNVKLQTCIGDKTVTTDADGRFSFPAPLDISFCVRPIEGVPEGAKLDRTNNNIEVANNTTYEYQIAGVNAYRSVWYLLRPQFNWDRKNDTGYNFYYVK
jgi:hypothetical protein